MIEGTYDEDIQGEVELQPLLNPRDQENPTINPTRLMFVRNPNQTINVGISPSPSHLLGVPANHGGNHHSRRHGPSNSAVAPSPNVNTNGRNGPVGGGMDEIEMGVISSGRVAGLRSPN